MCEERLAVLLTSSESLSDEEAARLGKKDPDHEVYKYTLHITIHYYKTLLLAHGSGGRGG